MATSRAVAVALRSLGLRSNVSAVMPVTVRLKVMTSSPWRNPGGEVPG